MMDARNATTERFTQDAGTAGITRVRVPGPAGGVYSDRQPVSAELRNRPVRVEFASQTAPLGDLVDALSAQDVQIAFRWETEENTGVLRRTMPFTRFNGTMGGLLDAMRTGMGIVSWQEGNVVFLSDIDRYAVVLPQETQLMADVAKSLGELGATNIVTSLESGKILYTARPALQDETLRPFLDRTVRNLSTINLQVAVVSLALTDQSSQGFDWSRFSAMVDGRPEAIADAEGGSGPANLGASPTLPGSIADNAGSVINLASDALVLGTTNIGTVFGAKAVSSVSAAIGFLSSFGNTNVTQHVDLRTLSGKTVRFQSGQEIPYVSGVGAVAGESSVTGTAQTDKIQTGLEVEMTPRYDSQSHVVTVSVDMKLTDIIEFVQLSAGNQLGTISQPRTQNQQLTDIVQMRAGQTVIIGGLQYDREAYNGNEPSFMRGTGRSSSTAFGKRDQDVSRSSLFIILRPTVTIYETEGDVLAAGMTK